MRPLWKDVLIAVWLGILLPGILLNGLALNRHKETVQEPVTAQREIQDADSVMVLLQTGQGQMASVPMDDYLVNVLLAEMPASFEPEALKAQAVAARTYAWKALLTGGKHGDNSLCGDANCCQGYITAEAYQAAGGTEENLEKVRAAVSATTDEVLLYDGELIEATYFSSAGGVTESALAVWGTDYPYLQSVESPEDSSPRMQYWSEEAFQTILGRSLPGDATQWFGDVTYTSGGGVDEIDIAGEAYSGVQLRRLLGLRSTAFEISSGNGMITVSTVGYGHRVGLSQHGANAMAQEGYGYLQILAHYYPGTEIGKCR